MSTISIFHFTRYAHFCYEIHDYRSITLADIQVNWYIGDKETAAYEIDVILTDINVLITMIVKFKFTLKQDFQTKSDVSTRFYGLDHVEVGRTSPFVSKCCFNFNVKFLLISDSVRTVSVTVSDSIMTNNFLNK